MRKEYRKLITFWLTLLMIVNVAAPGCFASTDPSKADSDTIRMGYFEFGGMFEGAAEGAKKSGYCYEYMMQLATYTGWTYEFVYGSYSELYEKLRCGEIDILPYTNYNEQRGQEVLFADKALVEEEYYLAAQPGSAASLEALNGAVITTLEGADYNGLLLAYAAEKGLNADIRYFSSLEETWDAVRRGEAAATVFTSNAYNTEAWNCIGTFGKKPTYIAVAKNREDLLSQINEATELIDIDNPAYLGELYDLYFSDNPMRQSLSPEELQWMSKHPVLHVGGFVNDAPYLFTVDNENGTATGLTVDVIDGIIERLDIGITADYRGFNTLAEMEDALNTGLIDVIIPFYPNHYIAQQHNLVISNTVRVSNMELVYKKGLTYYDAVKRIATPATKLGIYYVQDTFPDCEVVGAQSIQDAVDKVLSGEATGAVAQNVVLHNVKEKYDGLDYLVLPEGCGTCFAARPENYCLIRVINRGLNYFSGSEISSIASQYNPEPNVTTLAYLTSHKEAAIMLAIIFVILIILAISLIQVNRLKKRADASNRAKTSFLFNMSHDIRTPMNAIKGFTAMAKKNVGDKEKVTEYLDKIDISGQQLLSLVNQVLEMARIESGRIELEEVAVDVRKEYDHAVTVLAEQAEANGLKFHNAFEDVTHDHVFADPARMNSIILNVSGNAMKYTPRGGSVDFSLREISARKDGYATFRLTVKDTGIGMSEEYQRHLFEPFSREKSSTVSRIQGAGLGMSIVKSFTDLMGGDIEMQSEPGHGTRFDITLDFRIDEHPKKTKETDETSVSLEGWRVLLAEDNEMNREIAVDILRDVGLEVEEAENGSIAVEMLKEKGPDHYDFILMDIQMPVMNGYEATRAIRSMYPDRHIPIIALSANAFAEDKLKSREAGMDDHVAKPINIRELLNALVRFL